MTVSTAAPDHKATHRLKVVVTMETRATGWELLAPGWSEGDVPRAGRCDFLLNPDGCVDADFWIVFANARPRDTVRCAPENTLFIAGEPEEKKIYPKAFYRQFYRIIDTHLGSGHPRIIQHAPCLSWHIGYDHEHARFRIDHEALVSMAPPATPKNQVSVVCSDAAFTPGQRERLRFLATLKAELGDQIAHYGRGFQPVNDKLDAIHGTRYHLVLENCRVPHYWTEKLADAYLGWAFPLYVGSPNLGQYFPEISFASLDITSPGECVARIRALLAKPFAPAERAAVSVGRHLILDTYNPWVAWARWAEQFHQPDAEARETVIRSHKAYRSFPRGLIYRMRH